MAHYRQKLPTWGWSTCPTTSFTRSQILAMESAGTLQKWCVYTANDITSITAWGTAKFSAVALENNRISESGYYEWSFNVGNPFEADIQWSTGVIKYIFDTVRNNEVSGTVISSFPFSSSWVFNNRVTNWSINYTAGTLTNNVFENSNVTISWGTFTYNTVIGSSSVNISGWSSSYNTISNSSNVTIQWWNFSNNTVEASTTVTISWSSQRNTFSSGSSFTQLTTAGTTNYSNYVWSTISSTLTITRSSFLYSSYNSTNSTTGYISYLMADNANFNLQNIWQLYIQYANVSYSFINSNNATRLYMYGTRMESRSQLNISTGATFNSNYDTLSSYWYVRVTAWVLTTQYNIITSSWYISHANWTNRVYNNFISNGSIRIQWTSTWCLVQRCSITSNAAIYCTNSTNCKIYYCSSDTDSVVYTDGSTNARIYYSSWNSDATIRSIGNTWNHYIYYCNARSWWSIRMENNTSTNTRMYAIDSTSRSIALLQNSTWANANFYYSTFSAYFYAYIVSTSNTTKSWLFWMWRRTLNITDPLAIAPYASGTAWQNF